LETNPNLRLVGVLRRAAEGKCLLIVGFGIRNHPETLQGQFSFDGIVDLIVDLGQFINQIVLVPEAYGKELIRPFLLHRILKTSPSYQQPLIRVHPLHGPDQLVQCRPVYR